MTDSKLAHCIDGAFVAGSAIYPSLAGKKVIVSGGGSGIGEGIVEAFARQGAAVAFVDIMEEASDALVVRLADAPIAPIYVNCDICDCEDYGATIADIIEQLGGCDILINNAANDDRHKIEDVTPAYWDERMAVNLKHLFFAAQAVIPAMKVAGGGSIVNLGSISWHLGLPSLTLYQTAKAAIEGLTRSLARELGRDNIRVNTIVPGNVQNSAPTEMVHARGRGRDRCGTMPRRAHPAGRHRRDGAVPRLGRCALLHRA